MKIFSPALYPSTLFNDFVFSYSKMLVLTSGLVLSASLSPIGASAATGAENIDGWQLTASLAKPTFTSDEPILLTVTVQNTGGTMRSYEESSPQAEFKVVIKSGRGDVIPLTEFGKSNVPADTGVIFKRLLRRVGPGHALGYHFWLNRSFDLTLDGTYTVTVSHSFLKGDGHSSLTVVSNPVTFSIYEPQWISKPDQMLDVPQFITDK